jgi:hypothetical protein
MTHADALAHAAPPASRDRLLREVAFGFSFWLAFDLALEPGNIAHAVYTGAPIAWDQESLRLAGAGLLGAIATPPVLAMARRFPIEGPARWWRAAIQLAGVVGVSAAAIVASCLMADWWLASERRPFAVALQGEMTANLLLLSFCFAGIVAIAHATRRRPAPTAASGRLRRIPVKTRSGVAMLDPADIDWIETQGNYLALHAGLQTHLIRETAKRFEASLEPGRFARIHRRAIVAIDRIREITPLGSGDASVRLLAGTELRVSRVYRARLQALLNNVHEP